MPEEIKQKWQNMPDKASCGDIPKGLTTKVNLILSRDIASLKKGFTMVPNIALDDETISENALKALIQMIRFATHTKYMVNVHFSSMVLAGWCKWGIVKAKRALAELIKAHYVNRYWLSPAVKKNNSIYKRCYGYVIQVDKLMDTELLNARTQKVMDMGIIKDMQSMVDKIPFVDKINTCPPKKENNNTNTHKGTENEPCSNTNTKLTKESSSKVSIECNFEKKKIVDKYKEFKGCLLPDNEIYKLFAFFGYPDKKVMGNKGQRRFWVLQKVLAEIRGYLLPEPEIRGILGYMIAYPHSGNNDILVSFVDKCLLDRRGEVNC